MTSILTETNRQELKAWLDEIQNYLEKSDTEVNAKLLVMTSAVRQEILKPSIRENILLNPGDHDHDNDLQLAIYITAQNIKNKFQTAYIAEERDTREYLGLRKKALEIWVCTIAAGVDNEIYKKTKGVWELLERSSENLADTITYLQKLENKIVEKTNTPFQTHILTNTNAVEVKKIPVFRWPKD